MWWFVGVAALVLGVWVVNEIHLVKRYDLNWFGGVNYDYAVFAYIFFNYALIRRMYAHWDHNPTGWKKVWWLIYKREAK